MNPSNASNTENLQADIVVIGGGGSGMAAAIAAAEKGAKNVIVLEKRRRPGGNSVFPEGIFAAESPAQKRLGIDAPKDVVFRQAMDFSHWKIDPRIFRAFVDKSGDTIRWLEEKGLIFDRVRPLYPDQFPLVWHSSGVRLGPPLVKTLVKSCESMGIRLLCRAAAKKILTSEAGNVTGVLATAEDKELRINAKSVIIATGGFGGNKELLKKHYPFYSENLYHAGVPFNGDGLLMATEIGAATEGLVTLILIGPYCPKSAPLTVVARQPNMVWVNKKGERFADESIVSRFTYGGNAIDRQPDHTFYALFDEKIKQGIMEGEISFLEEILGGSKTWPARLDKELKLHADKGWIKIANSGGEIAEWAGVAPEVLKTTIDEYNSCCDRGYDEIFLKDRRYLSPLRTPPYYAIKCDRRFDNTIGGIKINHHMEVINHQDSPIRGLYAAGVDTGGWQIDTYDCILSGTSIGFAINSGRIGGENAAKYVLGK